MKNREDIQALRGIAVLLVVLFHARLNFLDAGYLGVDIFFVISGFLITSMVTSQIQRSSFSFGEFYFFDLFTLPEACENSINCSFIKLHSRCDRDRSDVLYDIILSDE